MTTEPWAPNLVKADASNLGNILRMAQENPDVTLKQKEVRNPLGDYDHVVTLTSKGGKKPFARLVLKSTGVWFIEVEAKV